MSLFTTNLKLSTTGFKHFLCPIPNLYSFKQRVGHYEISNTFISAGRINRRALTLLLSLLLSLYWVRLYLESYLRYPRQHFGGGVGMHSTLMN